MFNFLRLLFHFHEWETVFSKITKCCCSNIFLSEKSSNEAGELRIEKCAVCGHERGLMITLDGKTDVDPGFIRAYCKEMQNDG